MRTRDAQRRQSTAYAVEFFDGLNALSLMLQAANGQPFMPGQSRMFGPIATLAQAVQGDSVEGAATTFEIDLSSAA